MKKYEATDIDLFRKKSGIPVVDEVIILKIYSPITAEFLPIDESNYEEDDQSEKDWDAAEWEEEECIEYDPYRAELLNGTDLLKYKNSIIVALQEMNEPHAGWSGDLMSVYNKGDGLAQKVTSLKISIEIHEGALCGCATVTLTEDLKPGEMQALMDYITTQYSKGYGKIFAEQAIDVDDGRLFVYLWQQKNFTLTVELERRTTRELAKSLPRPKMKLSGGKGNIFSIVREADTLLSCYGYLKQTDEMYARIDKAETYREVLDIISEYVETELSVPPRPHTPKKGGDAR